jgi:hypothetical protein
MVNIQGEFFLPIPFFPVFFTLFELILSQFCYSFELPATGHVPMDRQPEQVAPQE